MYGQGGKERVICVYVHRFSETTAILRLEDVVVEPEIPSQLRLCWNGRPRVQLYVRSHSNPFPRLQGYDRVPTFRRAIQLNPPNA